MNILHIAKSGAITTSFFTFLEIHFDCSGHFILSCSRKNQWDNLTKIKYANYNGFKWIRYFIIKTNQAEKIIIHGLFDYYVIFFLFLQPWVLKKCYWVIWGGDLYRYQLSLRGRRWLSLELLRRPVIKRMGHLVTYVRGDVDRAREWYGAKGKYHECIMYPSNLYHELTVQEKQHDTINILIGNSAAPSNDHLAILEKLLPLKSQKILIHAPLSYGDKDYAQLIAKTGKDMFGDKFIPMLDFISFKQYLEFLGVIDIAIFNHRRQQGMGNIITLLGLGKKVYMRDDVTSYEMFCSHDIKIYPIYKLDTDCIGQIDCMSKDLIIKNIVNVKSYFSELQIVNQWIKIFEG